MRILAFSDLHRDVVAARSIVAASAEADVIVGAGDFATRGEGAKDTLDILHSAQIPVVLVFGNHDRPEELRMLCQDWASGYLLHGDMVELYGITFFGVGGEIPGRNTEPWNTALTEDEGHRILQGCPKTPSSSPIPLLMNVPTSKGMERMKGAVQFVPRSTKSSRFFVFVAISILLGGVSASWVGPK